ncbi:MAG: hypothetical protein JST92_03350 [Deltaproteobacteria bacterium]|nr:hypothetical protein [Deltaproteobacteria bacterium]
MTHTKTFTQRLAHLPLLSRLPLLVLALVLALPAHATGEFKARGFTLPAGAVRVDDDRYRLMQNWEEALKWYRQWYPEAKYPRRSLPSQSSVRAINIANPKTSEEWESVNLYEFGKGEVRVFVLARAGWVDEGEKPAPAPAKGTLKVPAKKAKGN